MDNHYQELMHFVGGNTDEVICRNWANDLRKKDAAAQLAAEANELMAEMADTIEMLRACCNDTGADDEAAHTLHLYAQYKNQAND